MLLLILLVLLACTLFYAYLNTKKAVFNHVTLPVDQEWRGRLNILHLSDLHMENISISPARLKEEIAGEHIDLIALTGDYLDKAKSIPKFLHYVDMLKEIPCRYGIYVVFGNHDYVLREEDLLHLKKELENRGCHVLINESSQINVQGNLVHIIGIDDYHTRRSNLKKAYENVGEGIHLVLTHDPNVILTMKDYPCDYLLSGHFHGGQIHYPKAYHLVKMGKLPGMNIIKGLHYHNDKAFYISEGLGQTGFNLRLRSRPEITLHTLTAKAE